MRKGLVRIVALTMCMAAAFCLVAFVMAGWDFSTWPERYRWLVLLIGLCAFWAVELMRMEVGDY